MIAARKVNIQSTRTNRRRYSTKFKNKKSEKIRRRSRMQTSNGRNEWKWTKKKEENCENAKLSIFAATHAHLYRRQRTNERQPKRRNGNCRAKMPRQRKSRWKYMSVKNIFYKIIIYGFKYIRNMQLKRFVFNYENLCETWKNMPTNVQWQCQWWNRAQKTNEIINRK